MERGSNFLLIGLFAAAFVLVVALFGGFVIALGMLFVAILALLVAELKKDAFEAVRPRSERAAKDRRFEIKKGQTVLLKNYGLNVKFLRIEAPKTAVHAHTPKVLRILVFRERHGKIMSFDVNNLRAVRMQKAFGREFNFLDFRNGRAILSIK
jgi:hypothetical protein